MDRVGLPGRYAGSILCLSQGLFMGTFGSKQFSIDPLILELKPPEDGPEPYLRGPAQQNHGGLSGDRLSVDPPSGVFLGKSLKLSEPQSLHLEMGVETLPSL